MRRDAWRLREDLVLTLGLRHERFVTRDGEQLLVASCTAAAGVDLRGQQRRQLQPRARLSRAAPVGQLAEGPISWHAEEDLLLKASFGRGVRFPNVEELYNGTFTASHRRRRAIRTRRRSARCPSN